MGFHYHWHHLGEEASERKTSSRILISRLLRYFLPHKKYLFIALLSVIATAITGVISPYLLGSEIISKYILKKERFRVLTIIL